MKSKLPIKISADFEVIVSKGDKIKSGDKIATRKKTSREEKIPLSSILSIKSENIPKHLTRRLGSKVKRGEVIAKKDSFVKSIKIVSPFDGVIASIDLKKGILILESSGVEEEYMFAPISGIIEDIMEEEVTLSVEGNLVKGSKGKGKTSFGDVVYYPKSELDMFDFTSEVMGKIIIAPRLTEGALAKLHALDARGVVATEYYEEFPSIVSLEPDLFDKIVSLKPPKLILLPGESSIIIPT